MGNLAPVFYSKRRDMVITWYGLSCFRIHESAQGHEVSIVTDPFSPEGGRKLPRSLTADIVISSHDHPRHNNIAAVGGDTFVIDGPGEFEVKDVFITGVDTYHDEAEGAEKGHNTIYFITVGGVHLAHLGDLKHPLSGKHLEDLHPIDVLFVPVGGGDVLDAKQAVDIVGQLDPRIVIPMHYKSGKTGDKLAGVDPFLKAVGVSGPERAAKLKVTDKTLPQEEIKYVILEPQ